jgi:hypothetical protein
VILIVQTEIVKRITLSADEALIDRARIRAARDNTTLTAVFRDWLDRYANAAMGPQEYKGLMNRLRHVRPARRFSRAEMNER